MEEKDFSKSIKLTFIILFGASLFWFLFACQFVWAYDPGGSPLDLKKNSRMNDTILIQPGTGTSGGSDTARFRTYYGTQACVGVGSNGYILSGTLTGLPFIDYLYGNGSSTINFSGFTHVAVGGSDIPSSSSVTGKIDAVAGTGTTNVFTDTTLAGQGTLTATLRSNGVDISPTEVGYLDGGTSNIQTQITTATGSITNHAHTGSDGTSQIAHNSVIGTGTNSHSTIDSFIASKASASGLASLDANSKVVQDPASGTSTPGANKVIMSLATGKLDDNWLSDNITKLGTPTTDSITEGSVNKYYSSAQFTTDYNLTTKWMSLGIIGTGTLNIATTGDATHTVTYNSTTGEGTVTIGISGSATAKPEIQEGGSPVVSNPSFYNFNANDFNIAVNGAGGDIGLPNEIRGTTSASAGYNVKLNNSGGINKELIDAVGNGYIPFGSASLGMDSSQYLSWDNQNNSITISYPQQITQQIDYNGTATLFVVPDNIVSDITITAYGASAGGLGGAATATVSVTPGETLYVHVGGVNSGTTSAGGYNGGGTGGDSGLGGGGSSDVRQGGNSLNNRILVAAGGGGSGSGATGGAGGGTTGGSGQYNGGSGGTQIAGGEGGVFNGSGTNGTDGSEGVGGTGGSGAGKGGGGGGGYYGGGGGGGSAYSGQAGGGGGGSSYTSGTGTSTASGVNTGNGRVILSYVVKNCTLTTNNTGVIIGTTTSPVTSVKMSAVSDDNATVRSTKINAAQASITAADIYDEFVSASGIEGSISGSGVAGVLTYNTFSGGHYTIIEDRTGLDMLDILEMTGENLTEWKRNELVWVEEEEIVLDVNGNPVFVEKLNDAGNLEKFNQYRKKSRQIVVEKSISKMSPKPQLVKSKICSKRMSSAVWGVYAGTDPAGKDMMLSLGAGRIKVVNTGENIAIGNYLTSSDYTGYAEKQPDDILHNYTIGKASEAIAWEDGEQSREIACTLHGG